MKHDLRCFAFSGCIVYHQGFPCMGYRYLSSQKDEKKKKVLECLGISFKGSLKIAFLAFLVILTVVTKYIRIKILVQNPESFRQDRHTWYIVPSCLVRIAGGQVIRINFGDSGWDYLWRRKHFVIGLNNSSTIGVFFSAYTLLLTYWGGNLGRSLGASCVGYLNESWGGSQAFSDPV